MSSDLFSAVLANEFNDTVKEVQWLVDNYYIEYQTDAADGVYYWKIKDFEWNGLYYIKPNVIKSTHWRRHVGQPV